jgi:hypothetical protein
MSRAAITSGEHEHPAAASLPKRNERSDMSSKTNRDAAEGVFEKRRNAADKLSAEIADDRQKKLQADAVKTARLRDQRLAKQAADASAAAEATAAKGKVKRTLDS